LTAKEQNESRGAHYKSDCIEINNIQCQANIIEKLDKKGKYFSKQE